MSNSPHVQFVKASSNKKIGKIPCTNSERKTCPDACPMKGDTACYAEAGFYTRLNWDKIDSRERGKPFSELLSSVSKLADGTLWRHNVSGDLAGKRNKIDRTALRALTGANTGRRGFTYTHYPVIAGADRKTLKHNVDAIAQANSAGFTVNISANTPASAEDIREQFGLPTVTLVPNEDWWRGGHRRGKVVRCPAETSEAVTCASCQMCQRSEREVIVGFTAHGAGKTKTELIARG